MTKLLVATRNRGKQVEFRELLAPLGRELVFPDEVGLAPTADEDLLEVHDSFIANAIAKARWFAQRSNIETIADDSGLEVDALGGAPGVLSKRFSGVAGSAEEVSRCNREELLRQLQGIPRSERTARFRCALVLFKPNGVFDSAEGTVEGVIAEATRGMGGFGYDPIFWCDELGATFAEVSQEAKDSVSHRGRAVRSLIEVLHG